MRLLLDVNVLIALVWPTHAHHERTRSWFVGQREIDWATSPTTELGFVRLCANPAVVDPPLTPAEAAATMTTLRARKDHEFWPDDTAAGDVDWAAVLTFRHVPDAHLVTVARRRGGRVATLDRRLVARFGPAAAELVT